MATHLIELFDTSVGSLLSKQASGILGESAERVNTAIAIGVPSILTAIAQKAKTTSDAAGLIAYMAENNIDGSILSNASDWLQGNIETEKLMYSGATLSRYLFDDKLSGIVDIISTKSGLSTSSATSIIKLAAPFLMGILAKYKQEKGLDAAGVETLLASHASGIKTLLPPEISSALGLDLSSKAGTAQMPDENAITSKGRSNVLPWIILALTALGLFYLVQRGCSAEEEEQAPPVSVPDTTTVVKKSDKDVWLTFKLADGSTMRAYPNSFTAKVSAYLTGNSTEEQCFTFDKVSFEANSFKLAAGSEKQIGDLVLLLKAYPDIKVRIEGHTDDEGDERKNKDLAKERAKVIKTRLTDQGLSGGRIDIKGWGEEIPIAPNDSAAGRAKNRRLDVCIKK